MISSKVLGIQLASIRRFAPQIRQRFTGERKTNVQ
jgi:hypothetical protein